MKNQSTQILCEIDLEENGKHCGFLRLPHSVHRSAYGWIPIPIVSIKNGEGPVVLLMAGNHGDEYEGQVMLCELTKALESADIQGQIIILPMANFPAAKAGLRTSPIDQGNLNRSFPGDANGSPTEMIAHYIETELLRRADYLLDIHSGGSSLLYTPSLLMAKDNDALKQQQNMALLNCFGFPQLILFSNASGENYSSSAAKRQHCTSITAEVAGGGMITPWALELLRRGLYQYLHFIGILSSSKLQLIRPETAEDKKKNSTCYEIDSLNSYCYALDSGLFEPLVELGEHIVDGQSAAFIHDPETPWAQPVEVRFNTSGVVLCKRLPARVERGDCLFEIGSPIDAKNID